MHFSKIYLQDNFVPDIVQDQFRRKVIGIEISLSEGESLEDAKTTAENYIKEYIEKNTVYQSFPLIECQPPEPAVLPSIQVEKEEPERRIEEIIRECKTVEELKQWQYPANSNPISSFIYKAKLKELQS